MGRGCGDASRALIFLQYCPCFIGVPTSHCGNTLHHGLAFTRAAAQRRPPPLWIKANPMKNLIAIGIGAADAQIPA
jgi:hypothetical protein